MAETLLSPGVLARENDSSQVSQGPITVGAAIIGPAVKGPVEIPTTVTSYSQYKSIFGGTVESGSDSYNYLTGISVYNYFQNGGESVLVTRVTSGSFSSAESTLVSNNITTASNSFTLETLSEGDIMNNSGSESQGALTLGTKDNIRWEIASVNTSSGQFSLLVRRGDDNNRDKKILETWTNLSLDPKAENYIESVVGNSKKAVMTDGGTTYIQDQGTFRNKSSFIRVKSVHTKTPDYFDNNGIAKTAYTASLPIVGSGSFASAVGGLFNTASAANFYENVATADIQGLTAADYTTAVALMANKDEYQFNSITTPGVTSQNGASIVSSVANNSVNRGDSIAIVDLVNYQANVGTVTTQAAAFDSSYAAAYWPWCQTIDPETGKQVWVPASVMIPGVYAYTDASADAWFAPAGLTRGALGTVIRASTLR